MDAAPNTQPLRGGARNQNIGLMGKEAKVTLKLEHPTKKYPTKAMKHTVLKYLAYQTEYMLTVATLAEPGTRSGLINDLKQVKLLQKYVAGMKFKQVDVRKYVRKLPLAA